MVTLYLIKSGKAYDVTVLCDRITWSGRKGSPARSVMATMIDDPSVGSRPKIDIRKGQFFFLTENGKELFRGIIEKVQKNSSGSLSVTAYDNAIYLSNNRDTFTYKKKTATQIFKDLCGRYGMKIGSAANTKYKIPVLAKDKTTIYDVMLEALSQTYKSKGIRYYIYSMEGLIHLVARGENITKVLLLSGEDGNISQYTITRDISETKTRVKLTSKSGKTAVTKKDKKLEKSIGQRQDIDSPDENLNKKKLIKMAQNMLREKTLTDETMTLTAAGDSSVYAGKCVYVKLSEEDIDRAFYVDSDTHTWEGDQHTMMLTLNFATDLNAME